MERVGKHEGNQHFSRFGLWTPKNKAIRSTQLHQSQEIRISTNTPPLIINAVSHQDDAHILASS